MIKDRPEWTALRDVIERHAIHVLPPGQTMPARSPGQTWTNLFMLRRVTQDGVLLRACVDLMAYLMIDDGLDLREIQLAGMETGAIPLLAGFACLYSVPTLTVRKTPRDHGLHNRIEGRLHDDRQIVLIDDTLGGGSRVWWTWDTLHDRFALGAGIHGTVYTLLQNWPVDGVSRGDATLRTRTVFDRNDFDFTYAPGRDWPAP
jgi:hypothetical protein